MQLLSDKKCRLLELLDEQISLCKKCSLYTSGKIQTYWTPMSTYVCVTDPFSYEAQKVYLDALYENGLRKEEIALIHPINCRISILRGSEPEATRAQLISCCQWIRKFIRILEPPKILTLGYNAMYQISGSSKSLSTRNGYIDFTKHPFHRIVYLNSIHPQYVVDGKGTQKLLENCIEQFTKLNVS